LIGSTFAFSGLGWKTIREFSDTSMSKIGDPDKFKKAYRAYTPAQDDEAEQWLRETVCAIQTYLQRGNLTLQKMDAEEFEWISEVLKGGGVIRRYGTKIVADRLPETLSAELRALSEALKAAPEGTDR
jgi:hypothetical protein